MHLPSLFVLLVYVSGYMFVVFVGVCLACGIYYLVELAEEYTVTTKQLIRYTTLTQLALHICLFVYERFPLLPTFVGFVSHLSYLQLLTLFPSTNPLSFPFVAAFLLFIVDNIVWFRFFHFDVELFYRYRVAPTPAIASFFLLVVWLVPLSFFITLSVNDSVLPNTSMNNAATRGAGPSSATQGENRRRSRNLVMVCAEYVLGTVRKIMYAATSSSTQNDILSSTNRRYY